MAYQIIRLNVDFPQPLAAVFAHLSKHENLAAVFGIPVSRIVASADPNEPDGLGSVRLLKVGPVRIEETITVFDKNRLIEYRVTKGGFLKHHLGVMRFSEQGGGAHLDYTVEIESSIPGFTGLLAKGLDRGMRQGLKKLAQRPQL